MKENVYLSLGSNVGDRAGNIADAIRRLREVGDVKAVSSLYETSPVEITDQPWFLNAVAQVETTLDPEKLMAKLLEIERAMGRERTRPKGPRIIDLDILLFGEREVHSPSVDIPHPAMHERRFVLAPLAEIAPQALHPAKKLSAEKLLANLRTTDVVRLFDVAKPSK